MNCLNSITRVPKYCRKCGKSLKGKRYCKCGYVVDLPLSNLELRILGFRK